MTSRSFAVALSALVVAAGCAPDTFESAASEPGASDAAEASVPAPSADQAAVLAVAEAALVAISEEDMVAFTDLMFEEAVIVPTGDDYVQISSWADERARTLGGDIVERGFDAQVQVSGRVASVWLPYDLYIDGEWSHCGVDVFSLAKDEDRWRILSVAWSRLQPPACDPHPAGAPA